MGEVAKDVSKFLSHKSFEDLALQSLIEIFGEKSTQTLIFYIGGKDALKDPETFEERIRAIFRDGADLILNHIKRNATRNAGFSHGSR
ncbi:MAG: hypothetical protein ACUVQ5_05170 [Candidatus Methanomethylicaceae archaeon]